MLRWVVALAAVASTSAPAQQLRVSRLVWDELPQSDRDAVQRAATVEILDPGSFGQIMDAQGQDQSSPATTAGAQLGGALGSAAYVDRAFSGNNSYSAKTHLATSILGAVIGSSLDSKGRTQYQFRYAVKLGNGQVRMLDEFRADPFRQPPGLCVAVPSLAQVDQQICTNTAALIRQRYLQITAAPEPVPPTKANAPTLVVMPADVVTCKLGTLPPVQTEAEKCLSIGGVIQK